MLSLYYKQIMIL